LCIYICLVAAFTEGELQYKTTEASNPYDLFLHAFEGVLKSATVSLIPSLNFDPLITPPMLNISNEYKEPPPRKMGDGYKVIDSNTVTLKYFWDEPGMCIFWAVTTLKIVSKFEKFQ